MPAVLLVLLIGALTVAFLFNVRGQGYWRARANGFVVVAILLIGFAVVLGLGQLL